MHIRTDLAKDVDVAADPDAFVGGYVLVNRARNGVSVGIQELQLLAQNARTLPITRMWISFFSATMVYLPGTFTLANTGMNLTDDNDLGFAQLKAVVSQLRAGGITVFISMGGWNYNCFPYTYARYSVGGYGNHTPNYWKIQTFGKGDIDNCVEDNQFCYVCEPPSEGTTLADFSIFPEPTNSPTWQAAQAYVEAGANSSNPPKWNDDMVPNRPWTDPLTGITVTIPGSDLYVLENRDPYQDVVYLAKDLGVDGIDIDYEEIWHGDYFKVGQDPGPWDLPQTVYKYAAIAKDVIDNINAIQPSLRLSTAGGAVGAWNGSWWGGDLKGLWLHASNWYPEVVNFMATGPNSGGINVMTYDLSDNPEFHECPQDNVCTLPQQVQFYMNTYKESSIPANVGYEIGVPAYPDPTHDKTHQLPLTTDNLSQIISQTQTQFKGGFFWEMFKPQNTTENATPTQVAQAICKTVLPGNSRCNGVIPPKPTPPF